MAEAALMVLGSVLVMDDQEGVGQLLGMMLRDMGYEYEFTKNGEEAVESYRRAKVRGRPFDVVILDLTVPGGESGEMILKRLCDVDPRVKGIVSSGYVDDPIMQDFRKHGFVAALPKPYDMGILVETLNGILGQVHDDRDRGSAPCDVVKKGG